MTQQCIVADCSEKRAAKGFCNTHYRQMKRGQRSETGELLSDIRPKRADHSAPGTCKMSQCERPLVGRHFCSTHRSQYQSGIIDLEGNQLRERKRDHGSYRTEVRGYVKVRDLNHPRSNSAGYVFEHIVVMEKKLGRSLTKGEIVHHSNGVRNDNSPENLELRTTATHEPGHCPDVAIAVETLEHSTEDWDRDVLAGILQGTADMSRLLRPRAVPTGDLHYSAPYRGKRTGASRCTVEGCPRPIKSKQMCEMHYFRVHRRGQPPEGVNDHGLPVGFIRSSPGYIWVKTPDHPCAMKGGYALVHRVVMSNYLGRALTPQEVVHHRNGCREDNRLSNLQLMSVAENARGYCRNADQALRLLAVTWPAGAAYADRLAALLPEAEDDAFDLPALRIVATSRS